MTEHKPRPVKLDNITKHRKYQKTTEKVIEKIFPDWWRVVLSIVPFGGVLAIWAVYSIFLIALTF